MSPSVLLIDDSAILRRIATNVLGAPPLRCEVVSATRATEGFARACAVLPSVILMDSQLAGTAQAEICQRYLDEPRTAKAPVILLLGKGMAVPAMADLPANVVDTLSKPFTPEQLNATVETLLRASRDDPTFAAIRRCMAQERQSSTTQLGGHKSAIDSVVRTATSGRSGQQSLFGTLSAAPLTGATNENVPTESQARPRTTDAKFGVLREAFQKAASQKGSGVLTIATSDLPPVEIFFDASSVVAVTTRDASAYSQDAADALPAKVSPATLEAALDAQRETGVPFILNLGARGLLSKASGVELLHRFGQRYFSRLWERRRSQLRSTYTPLDALPGFALRLDLRRESVDEWLLATLRCLASEDVAAAANHEGLVGTPFFLRNGQSLLNFLELTSQEKEFARRVTGRVDLPTIAKGMGVSTEAAYLRLYRFRALEIMDYRPAPVAYVVTPRTSVRRVLPLRH